MAITMMEEGRMHSCACGGVGQTLCKPYGLKLEAEHVPKGNSVGVGKGSGALQPLPQKRDMHAQLAEATAVCYSSPAGVRISLGHL